MPATLLRSCCLGVTSGDICLSNTPSQNKSRHCQNLPIQCIVVTIFNIVEIAILPSIRWFELSMHQSYIVTTTVAVNVALVTVVSLVSTWCG